MRHCIELPPWLLVTLALGLGAKAVVADTPANPYSRITGRNIFGLRAERQPPEPPAAPLPRVVAVGITTLLPNKCALLKVYWPARPPEPAREVSCILAVGQREGPIEVLEIDEGTASIKINNSGKVMVLTLAMDGPKPQTAPPAAGLPPLPFQAASRRP